MSGVNKKQAGRIRGGRTFYGCLTNELMSDRLKTTILGDALREELFQLVKEALREELDAPTEHKEPDSDGLMDIKQAAAFLHVTPSWLYKNAPRLPFRRKVGGSLRFDMRAMKNWLATKPR